MRFSTFLATLPDRDAHLLVNELAVLCGDVALAARQLSDRPQRRLGRVALAHVAAATLDAALSRLAPDAARPLPPPPRAVPGPVPDIVLPVAVATAVLGAAVLGDAELAVVRGHLAATLEALGEVRGAFLRAVAPVEVDVR